MSPVVPKNKRRILILLTVLALLALSIWFLSKPGHGTASKDIQDNRFLLDTVVNIHLYGSDNPVVLENAFAKIEQYEELLSRHKEGSDISKINSAAANSPTIVANDTFNLILTALKYAELSKGAFDPTVGPLVDIWGIGTEDAAIPEPDEIRWALDHVDYRQVSVDPGTSEVSLNKDDMILELGGVAKGWIADRIAEELRDAGEEHILINLGGNVLVSGGKPGGKSFRIGMQNPFDSRGSYLGVFTVKNRSIVSSGIYERYFEVDGVRYHHILDTTTGFPVNNGLAAVTLLTDNSVDGDALSTTVFALGPEAGLDLVKTLPDTEAAFVTMDGQIIMTQGAADIFQLSDTEKTLEIR